MSFGFRKPLSFLMLASFIAVGAGCASNVKREESSTSSFLGKDTRYAELKLFLNDQAKKLVTENIVFSPESLRSKLAQTLDAKGLMAKDAATFIEVEVTDIRARSTFSAIMFGFMAGQDHITGNIYVKNNDGKTVTKFEVSASYALGGLAGGQDSARMNWLYEEFAKLTVNELTGEVKR